MIRNYRTEGIILKRTNFGEADRILTIFTKHYGKIKARAPGIRRTLSRKAAHLEAFNLSTLFLAQGKSLDILTEAQTINNFGKLRKNLNKVGTAYYLCELVDSLCPEKQENREVLELLKEKLKELEDKNENLDYLADDFANNLLWNLGYLQKTKRLEGGELKNFIENILERKLRSSKLLTNL